MPNEAIEHIASGLSKCAESTPQSLFSRELICGFKILDRCTLCWVALNRNSQFAVPESFAAFDRVSANLTTIPSFLEARLRNALMTVRETSPTLSNPLYDV